MFKFFDNGQFIEEASPTKFRIESSFPIKEYDLMLRENYLFLMRCTYLEIFTVDWNIICKIKLFKKIDEYFGELCEKNGIFKGMTSSLERVYVWTENEVYSVDLENRTSSRIFDFKPPYEIKGVYGLDQKGDGLPRMALWATENESLDSDDTIYFLEENQKISNNQLFQSQPSIRRKFDGVIKAVSNSYIIECSKKNLIIHTHDYQTILSSKKLRLKGRILDVDIKGNIIIVLVKDSEMERSFTFITHYYGIQEKSIPFPNGNTILIKNN